MAPLKSKAAWRQLARSRRRNLVDRPARSRTIFERLLLLPELQQAETLGLYVGVRSEVATRDLLRYLLARHRRVGLPYCSGDQLCLVRIDSLEQLQPGAYGIPEPAPRLRQQVDRQLAASDVDLFVVPGLAFDRQGVRLGQGAGYYDRLLRAARPDAIKVGLAFACQVFGALPHEPHDIPLDILVTEAAVHRPGLL